MCFSTVYNFGKHKDKLLKFYVDNKKQEPQKNAWKLALGKRQGLSVWMQPFSLKTAVCTKDLLTNYKSREAGL